MIQRSSGTSWPRAGVAGVRYQLIDLSCKEFTTQTTRGSARQVTHLPERLALMLLRNKIANKIVIDTC